ncbi:phage tail protein [Flexibacterium corallicola]|uniref:phage tail protein n=1 Tax=Flexibacterium corallicola TaxID=3037259 RepID=UPI00286F8D4E|nr:tail fiber protein [Pseudovibrio sp. M1P-2-3]
MAEPFISQVSAFGLEFTIRNWARCQGQIMAISQNEMLFSLISNVYGGDGRVSFGVPNLIGRTVLHSGQGPGLGVYPIGSFNSQRDQVLTIRELPSHAHIIRQKAQPYSGTDLVPTADTITAIPEGTFSGLPITADWYAAASNLTDLSSQGSPSTSVKGSSFPIPTISPYQVITYEIALIGIYPSRS